MRSFSLRAVLAALLVLTCHRANAAHVSLDLDTMSEPAPALVWTDEAGHEHQLSDYKGRVVVLHFWASWCTPCQKEMPQLKDLVQNLKQDSAVFVAVSVDDVADRAAVAKILRAIHSTDGALIVKPAEKTKPYYAWGVPITYFISADQIIKARALGSRDWNQVSQTELTNLVKKLAAKKGS